MPSIKCMSCGNRILLPTDQETCANCGALLSQQLMAAQQSAAVEQLLNPFIQEGAPTGEIVAPPEQPSTGMVSRSLHLPAPDGQETPLLDESTDKMRALQLYPDPNQAPPREQEQRGIQLYQQPGLTPYGPPGYGLQPYQPYQSTQLVPFADPRGALVPFAGDDAGAFVPQLGPLPRGFPQRPPDISGAVIHTQTQMENPIMPDSVEFFVKTFRDLLWAVPGENASRDRTVQVITMRVRTSDGSIKDARVEGYMRGVNVSLGDTVSLWGIKRRGLLLIYRGYNYSTKGTIKTTASNTMLTGCLLILIFLGLGLWLSESLHLHLPWSLPFLPH